MTDREKVIKGLERCQKKRIIHGVACLECPYAEAEGGTDDWCVNGLYRDALALLKEQEPVESEIAHYIDGSKWWYECKACGAEIRIADKYCHECGRKMKWK